MQYSSAGQAAEDLLVVSLKTQQLGGTADIEPTTIAANCENF